MYKASIRTTETKTVWICDGLPSPQQLKNHVPAIVEMQPNIRQLLERGLVHGIIDTEYVQKYDYVHHRGSGFDRVLAQLCAKHNVTLFINYEKLKTFYTNTSVFAALLGRINQNKRLAKKYGVLVEEIEHITRQ